jgi:hypothetical protein
VHFSPNAHIRALESTFYDIARRKISDGAGLYDDQRVIQLIQASTILSVYCYSKARYNEGWLHGGVSLHLADSRRTPGLIKSLDLMI